MRSMRALSIAAITWTAALTALLAVFAYLSEPLDGEPYVFLDIADRSKTFDTTIPLDRKTYDPRKPIIAVKAVEEEGWAATTTAQHVNLSGPRSPQSSNAIDAASLGELPDAPIRALVENSRFGPLPRISDDGRRPSDSYARPASPGAEKSKPARIAIVIQGLGLNYVETGDAIDSLPGPVSLAFGPYGKNLQDWIRKARKDGHEVLLQIPLEPFDYPDNDPGPHTLLSSLKATDNLYRLKWLMGRFTGYTGVTNAMGAKFLTRHEALRPVWQELKMRGLTYFESTRTTDSFGDQVAGDIGLSYGAVEVLLDEKRTKKHIDDALSQLEQRARKQGLSIGVGTALPLTIESIEKWSKGLAKKGIELIPVSAAIRARRRT